MTHHHKTLRHPTLSLSLRFNNVLVALCNVEYQALSVPWVKLEAILRPDSAAGGSPIVHWRVAPFWET